jgi:hypothetical protein
MWTARVAILVAAAATLAGQQPQAPPAPRTGALAPGGTGLLAGRVFDPASGKAVPEAIVWLLVDGVFRDQSPRVMADAEGRFVFVNVPAGRYSLQAEKLGYRRGFFGQKVHMDTGRELDVAGGQFLMDLALPIWKHAAIGGTVTDEGGEPVVGAGVRAFRKIVTHGLIRLTPLFQGTFATTDDRGMYRLASLEPGEYVVGVPSTLTTFPVDIMDRMLGAGELRNEVSTAISETAPLGYRQNQQVGASVILTTHVTPVPPTPGDADVGAVYRTTFSPSVTTLNAARVIAVGPGDDVTAVNILLKPTRAVSVSGHLVVPEGSIRPTAVRLVPTDEAFSSYGRGFETATGLSDAAGRFTLLGVPPGSYILWVESRSPGPAGPPGLATFWWAGEPVTVGSSPVTDLTVALRRPPRLTVRMEVRSGQSLQPGAIVLLVEPLGPGTFARQAPEAGREISVHLAPGRYLVTPVLSGEVFCTAVLFGNRDVSDEPLVIDRDDVDVTIVCGDTPTKLSGTVRNDRGTADADTLVVVFPADRRFWPGPGVRPRRITSARPSASGAFSFVNLPAGEYFAAAIPVETSDFWQAPATLEVLARSATRVTIGAGEARTVDLRTVRIR